MWFSLASGYGVSCLKAEEETVTVVRHDAFCPGQVALSTLIKHLSQLSSYLVRAYCLSRVDPPQVDASWVQTQHLLICCFHHLRAAQRDRWTKRWQTATLPEVFKEVNMTPPSPPSAPSPHHPSCISHFPLIRSACLQDGLISVSIWGD